MIININGVDVEISKEEEAIFMDSFPTYAPDKNYRIGKSTPWRRMTDDEAIAVSNAMKQQTIKNQMIYDAASYIDTSDELFGTLKGLLTQLFTASRAEELLAPEVAQ